MNPRRWLTYQPRPRSTCIIELGYSSDTRYRDNVKEKRKQNAELCKLLAAEEYDVMLLPVPGWDNFERLARATREKDNPNARKKK
jgi:hypothetical protein